MTEQDIEAAKRGPDSPGLDAFSAALLRSVDQLRTSSTIDDQVWAVLKTRYDDKQLMDVVITTGQYNLISWYLNSLGTPIEAGVSPQPMSSN